MSNETNQDIYEVSELEKAFNTFYMNFPYTKLNVQDDCITYKVPFGYSREIAKEANVLIHHLNLPLEAKTHSTYGIFEDVVMVIPKKD